MPYLPFDLDAKRKAALVARATGVQTCVIGWGLLELWEHVWRQKSDVVSGFDLTGCFGPVPMLAEALVGAGFLELAEGGYRVCGAGKWLLGLEGRSRGGHAAKENLVPGAKHRAKRPPVPEPPPEPIGSSREPAESQPIPPIGSPSALSSSIQHPASRKEEPPPTPSGEEEVVQDPLGPAAFWAFAQEERRKRGRAEEWKRPKGFADWHRTARAQAGPYLGIAYCRFLDDTGITAPGHPMAVFMTDDVWRPRVPAEAHQEAAHA